MLCYSVTLNIIKIVQVLMNILIFTLIDVNRYYRLLEISLTVCRNLVHLMHQGIRKTIVEATAVSVLAYVHQEPTDSVWTHSFRNWLLKEVLFLY